MKNRLLKFDEFKNGNTLVEPKKHALAVKLADPVKKEKTIDQVKKADLTPLDTNEPDYSKTVKNPVMEGIVEDNHVKIDDLKIDVKDMHDCLDNTRNGLQEQLEKMYSASCEQHSELAKKISSLENQRDKWVWTVAGGLVALSWASAHSETILKLFQ